EAPRRVRVQARAAAQFPLRRFELVVNGLVVSTNVVARNDREWVMDQEITLDQAGWLTVRCASANSSFPAGSTLVAHGNPIYIERPGHPLEARADAEYFLGWIDRLESDLKRRDRIPVDLERVQRQIETARTFYRRLASAPAK